MRQYHPEEFESGHKYVLAGRGEDVWTFDAVTRYEYPDGRAVPILVFSRPDAVFPLDTVIRHIQTTSSLLAEEMS